MPDTTATGSSTPVSPIDAAQVLEDAADLLLIHGRCQGYMRNTVGEFCVTGALGMAAFGDPNVRAGTPLRALSDHLGTRAYVHPVARVMQWNDDTDDDDEVRDTLLLVAKELRGQAVPS